MLKRHTRRISFITVFTLILLIVPYFGGKVDVAFASEIIVDNGSASYTERYGTWTTAGSIGNGGTDVRRSNVQNATAMYWLPEGASEGYYTVQIYKVVAVDGDPEAVVGVRHTEGSESYSQDWTSGASGWVTLGTFHFNPGNADSVITLIRGKGSSGTGYVTADAVKFVPAPTYSPPPAPPFSSNPTPPGFLPEGYTLAFVEDFNGTELDETNWMTHDHTTLASGVAYNPENVTVSNGVLDIAMKKESFNGFDYTSGGVMSKRSFGFGYYEAKLKFSGTGSGWHQSFWLFTNLGIRKSTPDPSRFDSYDEVDIIETNSSNVNTYATNYHNWYWLNNSHSSSFGGHVATTSLSSNWHTFGALYTDNAIQFYLDGVYQNEIDTTFVSATVKNKLNIFLNAVKYEAMVDTNLPGHYQIDWVRFYAAPASSPEPEPSTYLFTDDFEDGNSTGWTTEAGTWSVVSEGTEVFKQTGTAVSGKVASGDLAWSDYAVQARIKANDFNAASASGIMFRYQDANNYYMFRLHESGKAQLYRKVGGAPAELLQESAQAVSPHTWYTLKIVANGNTINGYVNGVQKIANVKDSSFSTGKIGAISYLQSFSIDDVEVYEVDSILFSDDFEDGNASGWTESAGNWSVVTDGSRVYKQTSTGTSGRTYAGNAAWTDYSVEARIKPNELPASSASGVVARATSDGNNYYWLRLHESGHVQLYKKINGGSAILLQEVIYPVNANTWYTLKLEVKGTALKGYVNGSLKLAVMDSSLTNGLMGISSYQQSYSVDNVVVTEIN